jgi:putative NADH-flavin reductase
MRIAVLGASGRTGSSLVDAGLARGLEIAALVRDPARFDDRAGRVTVYVGDARDPDAIVELLEGVDTIVSSMGPAGDQPGGVYSDAIHVLLSVIGAGDHRLVISANARVFDDRPLSGPYAEVSQEHRRVLAALQSLGEVGPRWTVVATPMLADRGPRGAYDAVLGGAAAGSDIARADFALALLDALDHDDWIRRCVGVGG